MNRAFILLYAAVSTMIVSILTLIPAILTYACVKLLMLIFAPFTRVHVHSKGAARGH